MNYRRLNVIIGWLVFLIATAVYFLTVEDTVSLWDCGEYIMAAYKLEVGHPPGAPTFMLLGRIFSMFAAEENVALWINRMSALSSSFTILFMFWSITLLVKKMILDRKPSLSTGDIIAIMGSGVVGALAYTFSDTFWFSAVEGEVYAMSSLFTAMVFWAILKWDEEMALIQNGKLSLHLAPNRWLLLIFFLIGIAIGVHLLGILLIPAIGYVIYFRTWKDIKPKNFIITGLLSLIILAIIQEGVIPGTIKIADSFEVFFRNSLGLPFNAGTIFFFLLLFGLLILGIVYARKNKHTIAYNSFIALFFLFIGYGTFAVIVIRSNADTPMDQNNPENLVNLQSYLTREQYGSTPLLTGPYWNSMENGGQFIDGEWQLTDNSQWKDRAAILSRRFIVSKDDKVLSVFLREEDASKFAKEHRADVEEKYYETNSGVFREKANPTYAQKTIFPRMFSGDDARKVDGYKMWSGYDISATDREIGKDKAPLPSMGENINYFTRYQVNWMYIRYFMWNFAGRQNDVQGDGNQINGNWKSGFSHIDTPRLGDQTMAPHFTTENPTNNSFFLIPLVLGLIGLFFHAYRSPKDAFVVFLGFLLTGLAIVVYLNQKVYEPRERDYAYAGSFYFFALWIGIGVYALYSTFIAFTKEHMKKFLIIAGAGLLLFFIIDFSSEHSLPSTLTWLTIIIMAAALLGIMYLVGKSNKNEVVGASLASLLALSAPIIMGAQGWDDHDRSNKTTAHDVAYNYLSAILDNGIIFTNGDNDTFPLWYLQEVENYKNSVRVANLSLMQTDWYTAQMMRKTYGSDPLPIKFTPDQVLSYTGGTDQIPFYGDLSAMFVSPTAPAQATLKAIVDMRLKNNKTAAVAAINNFALSMQEVISSFEISSPSIQNRVNQLRATVTRPAQEENLTQDILERFNVLREMYSALRNQSIKPTEKTVNGFQAALTSISKGWESIDLVDAMAFVRDDKNMLGEPGERAQRFFPSNEFTWKINKDNFLKSGMIAANTPKSDIMDEARLKFDARSITREEIMMLDILANNDFKRGIYFSNARASKVSNALLNAGLIKQTGSVYEVNALKTDVPIDADKMYESLMKGQRFGKMYDPTVLTDYYARRHVSMYRSQFATLTKYYLHRIDQAKQISAFSDEQFQMLLLQNGANEKDFRFLRENSDSIIKESRLRAKEIINRCLEVMPINHVFDGGEPMMAATFKVGSNTFPRYAEGVTADFVQMLYDVQAYDQAEKLGLEVIAQQKKTIEYFLNAPAFIALGSRNQPHFYAALDSYLQVFAAASTDKARNQSKLSQETDKYVTELYTKKFKTWFAELDDYVMSISNDEIKASRAIDVRMLKDYIEAISIDYGFGDQTPSVQGSDMDFEQLMQQQMRSDSLNPENFK